jgi:hypothetical protein
MVSAPPPPLPAPTAPPLPFRFVGEFVLPTETQIFLARGDDTFQVNEGETISDEYRVESLKADEIVLLHLASGVHQTVRFTLSGQENIAQTAQAPIPSATPVAPALSVIRTNQ